MASADEKRAPTVREIAVASGVSIGTVDRVLHGRGRAAPETAARVMEAVERLGYKPNLWASNLKNNSFKTILALYPLPEQDSGYWRLCAAGFDRAAAELAPFQARCLTANFNRHSKSDFGRACAEASALVASGEVQALALAPVRAAESLAFVAGLPEGFPLAFFDCDIDTPRPHCFLGHDPYQSGRVAARLACMVAGISPLAAATEPDIAKATRLRPGFRALMISFREDDPHLARRCAGFRDGMVENAGLRVGELFQSQTAPARERRAEFASALLDATDPGDPGPIAAFVPNALVHEYLVEHPGLFLIGYDLVDANEKALGQGRIAAILSQEPERAASESLRRLHRAVALGQDLPARVPSRLDIIVKESL